MTLLPQLNSISNPWRIAVGVTALNGGACDAAIESTLAFSLALSRCGLSSDVLAYPPASTTVSGALAPSTCVSFGSFALKVSLFSVPTFRCTEVDLSLLQVKRDLFKLYRPPLPMFFWMTRAHGFVSVCESGFILTQTLNSTTCW